MPETKLEGHLGYQTRSYLKKKKNGEREFAVYQNNPCCAPLAPHTDHQGQQSTYRSVLLAMLRKNPWACLPETWRSSFTDRTGIRQNQL